MKKMLVDCSLPVDHPEHTKMVELTDKEKVQRQKDKDAARERRSRRTPHDVLAEKVEKAETLDDLKAAMMAFARGETE